MRNSKDCQLAVQNKETYLSTESKDAIQSAIALAINNGMKIDVAQDHSTDVASNIGIKFGSDGISMNIGCSLRRKKKNIYIMKD